MAIKTKNSKCKEGEIILFLNQSLLEKKLGIRDKGRFRTTHAISSALDIDKEKVTKICSNSKFIKRNKEQKESWTLKIYGVKN